MPGKRLIIFLIIICLPFLSMVIVNECFKTPARTDKYMEAHCTWYCHNVTCPHWKQSYKDNPTRIKKMHKDVFDWYVVSLYNNPLGLNYGVINILVFIIIYPLLGGILVWRLINKVMC